MKKDCFNEAENSFICKRDFSEPAIRKGGLVKGTSTLAKEKGQIIHDEIQSDLSEQFDSYEKEKALKIVFQHEHFELGVSGRADGYFCDENLVEEIKTAQNLEKLEKKLSEDKEHPYILQLYCYAFIIYEQTGDKPSMRLRLCSQKTRETKIIDIDFDPDWYRDWLEKKLESIYELQKKEARK